MTRCIEAVILLKSLLPPASAILFHSGPFCPKLALASTSHVPRPTLLLLNLCNPRNQWMPFPFLSPPSELRFQVFPPEADPPLADRFHPSSFILLSAFCPKLLFSELRPHPGFIRGRHGRSRVAEAAMQCKHGREGFVREFRVVRGETLPPLRAPIFVVNPSACLFHFVTFCTFCPKLAPAFTSHVPRPTLLFLHQRNQRNQWMTSSYLPLTRLASVSIIIAKY